MGGRIENERVKLKILASPATLRCHTMTSLNLYDRMANVTLKKDVSHKRESCIANFFLAFSTPPHGLFDLLTPPHTSSHPLTPPQASSLPLITSSLPPQALFDFTSHFRNLLALHQNGKTPKKRRDEVSKRRQRG